VKPPDPWVAYNQLEWILSYLPDPGYLVEHGGGGSSLWYHDKLTETQRHTVIECDHTWVTQLRLLRPRLDIQKTEEHHGRHPDGMEHSCFDPVYIGRGEFKEADVIVVDGYNRGSTLAWISWFAKDGCQVFVHDVNPDFVWATYLPPFKDRENKQSDGTNNPNWMMRFRVERT
jgi:hypothetical protein